MRNLGIAILVLFALLAGVCSLILLSQLFIFPWKGPFGVGEFAPFILLLAAASLAATLLFLIWTLRLLRPSPPPDDGLLRLQRFLLFLTALALGTPSAYVLILGFQEGWQGWDTLLVVLVFAGPGLAVAAICLWRIRQPRP